MNEQKLKRFLRKWVKPVDEDVAQQFETDLEKLFEPGQEKPLEVERCEMIPVMQRSNPQHLLLIRYYGGVREYLLAMGEFKDDCDLQVLNAFKLDEQKFIELTQL